MDGVIVRGIDDVIVDSSIVCDKVGVKRDVPLNDGPVEKESVEEAPIEDDVPAEEFPTEDVPKENDVKI